MVKLKTETYKGYEIIFKKSDIGGVYAIVPQDNSYDWETKAPTKQEAFDYMKNLIDYMIDPKDIEESENDDYGNITKEYFIKKEKMKKIQEKFRQRVRDYKQMGFSPLKSISMVEIEMEKDLKFLKEMANGDK